MKENASEKKQPHFEGLKVAAFESRRSTEMSNLISKMGGVPDVTPSMREIPIEKNIEGKVSEKPKVDPVEDSTMKSVKPEKVDPIE